MLVVLVLAFCAVASAQERLNFKVEKRADTFNNAAAEAGFQTRFGHGVHFSATVWRASNGEGITSEFAEFRSTEEAERYLDWELKKVKKVISLKTTVESHRWKTGRRAEALMDGRWVEIMWTDGPNFRVIIAPNFDDALQLEDRLNPSTPQSVR